MPIKGRLGGTPIVEVTFNDKKFDMLFDTGASHTLITLSTAATLHLPVTGFSKARIASGSVVILPLALVKSQEIDGRFRMRVPVAFAPTGEYGLLGQDFYKGYDVAVKEDVIEFRRQSYSSVNQRKTACIVDTNPQSFSVPIINHQHDIPVVEVTFNNNYTFPMLFDTGASSTMITRRMAARMGLKLIGLEPVELADGSVAAFAIAPVKSQQVASRIKHDLDVAVAPSADVGLLGARFL